MKLIKRKTSLFGQLCRLEPHCAVKRLFMSWLINHYLYNKLETGFIVDVFRILEEYALSYVLSEFITSGTLQSRHSWKKLARSKIAEASVRNFESVNAEDALYRFGTMVHVMHVHFMFFSQCFKIWNHHFQKTTCQDMP